MRADDFEPTDEDTRQRWANYGRWPDRPTLFPSLLGLEVLEVRTDYCRMRLPFRPDLNQPAGLVHGGALASLVDSVVVPAVGQAYPRGTQYATVSMTCNYVAPVREEDAIAEGWVVRRGRSTVFCRAEVRAGDRLAVEASLVYSVQRAR